MDDILKIANGVMKNFNPETDKVRDFTNLPDGEYTGLIEEVGSRISEAKGTPSVFFKVGITEGDSTGRFLWANYYFVGKMMEINIQKMISIAHQLGFDYNEIDFTDNASIAKSLEAVVGEEVTVVAKTSKDDFQNVEIVLA